MNRSDHIIRKTERSISIVKGYHDCTKIPDVTLSGNLRFRLAIILDTYRRDKKDMFFDAELFCEFIFRVCDLMLPEQVKVFLASGEVLNSLKTMKDRIFFENEEDRMPPKEVHLMKKGRVFCCVYTEFWIYSGGPTPYHDSYTFSIYTETDFSRHLIEICDNVCNNLNATIVSVYEASNTPILKRKVLVGIREKFFKFINKRTRNK